MDKNAIIQEFLAMLTSQLAMLTRAAQAAFAAATDPDSKAENKYDTRNLEASYIARGQAERVADLQAAVEVFEDFADIPRPARAIISLGALVQVETGGDVCYYFMASHGGGTELVYEGAEVCVLTPQSPLGEKLMGKRAGERVALRPGLNASVVAVS
jgi:hypothetical protein